MTTFDFLTSDDLRARGMGIRAIRQAIEAGSLERVIRGWYATPATKREPIRAMRLGGRLGCVSALALHGAWQPPDSGLHVHLPPHASGRRLAARGLPDGAVAHWAGHAASYDVRQPVAPLEIAVPQMLGCQPPDFSIAVLDSLLHRRRISRNRLESLLLGGPEHTRFLVDHLEPRSEEGIESLVRFRLRVAGLRCTVQVRIGRYRVDILIDDWLVLEIDGRETHGTADGFARDRVRSAALLRDGRVVVQLTYAQVIYHWPEVMALIHDVMRQFAPTA